MSQSQEIVFDGQTNLRSYLKIGIVWCLPVLIFAWLLWDMKSGTTHPLPSIPWGVVYAMIAGGGGCAVLFILMLLGVSDRYVYHLSRQELSHRLLVLGFTFSRILGQKSDIVGISVNSEQSTTKYETRVATYYQTALALKDGRIIPLTSMSHEEFQESADQAKAFAEVMKVPYVEGRGNAYMEVLDVGKGTFAIVHHAHKLFLR